MKDDTDLSRLEAKQGHTIGIIGTPAATDSVDIISRLKSVRNWNHEQVETPTIPNALCTACKYIFSNGSTWTDILIHFENNSPYME